MYFMTCRPVAREQAGEHVSVEMDSWKATRYGATFPWKRVINKHFLGYETKDVFSVGVSRCYITGASEEVMSNTSTVALRVVGVDEKRTQCLGV
jgi:hypothetical protein